MFCLRCGQEVPASAAFCASCGQPTQQPVAQAASYAPPPPPVQQASAAAYGSARQDLKGVSGGLLFFCLAFTILWPLWTFSQYAMYNFVIFRHLTLLGSLSLLRVALGIVVGIVLWTRSPAAIMLLRIYFAVAGVLTLWSIYNWVQLVARFHNNVSFPFVQSFVFGFIPSLVFLVAGIIYFATSERVRATYGSKLFG